MSTTHHQWTISPSLSAPKSWRSPTALQNLQLSPLSNPPTIIPPKHVLLQIRAASINARDMMVISYDPIYPITSQNKENLVPCADGAGEVLGVGEGSKWNVGDKVIVHATNWIDSSDERGVPGLVDSEGKGAGGVDGLLRGWGIFPDEQLIKAPSYLSMEELASIDVAGGTASHALFFGPKKIGPGMTLLVLGTGGVSCFAIQLASSAGATVLVTSSSDTKLQKAASLGATHLINYTTHPNWSSEVLRLTNGMGVDQVIENGGAATLGQSLRSTKRGGLVSLVGFLAGELKDRDMGLEEVYGEVLYGGKIVHGIFGLSVEHTQEAVNRFEKDEIRPAVAKVFEFGDAKEAFEYSMGYTGVGKTVIKV